MSLIVQSWIALTEALYGLLVPLAIFAVLALLVKGRRIFADMRKVLSETRVNLVVMSFNVVFVLPLLALFSTWLSTVLGHQGFHIFDGSDWQLLPEGLIILVAIFVGDFVGYWRHRLEHSRLLWPAHAVHHSDTAMTWLSLQRFHPINRLTTLAIDSADFAFARVSPFMRSSPTMLFATTTGTLFTPTFHGPMAAWERFSCLPPCIDGTTRKTPRRTTQTSPPYLPCSTNGSAPITCPALATPI